MYFEVWSLSKIWMAASTALTKRSQTLSNGTCVSRILSETDYDREKGIG